MVKAIVTHATPCHIDDTIGVALMKYEYPDAEIVRIRPQDTEAIEKYMAAGAAFVDVGGVYDPFLNMFDHHQNAELPCSAAMVANEFWYNYNFSAYDFAGSPAEKFMSIKDCRGFPTAVQETGHKPSLECGVAEGNLTLAAVEMTQEMANAVTGVISKMNGQETYEELVLALWEAMPDSIKAEAAARAVAKAKAEEEALASCSVLKVEGLRVAVSATHVIPPSAFKKLEVEVIVSVNAMDSSNISIIKDTNSLLSAKLDLSKASKATGMKQVFLHNSGFIVVLGGKVSDLDIADLFKGIID